jgi:hypothetical protein
MVFCLLDPQTSCLLDRPFCLPCVLSFRLLRLAFSSVFLSFFCLFPFRFDWSLCPLSCLLPCRLSCLLPYLFSRPLLCRLIRLLPYVLLCRFASSSLKFLVICLVLCCFVAFLCGIVFSSPVVCLVVLSSGCLVL